MQVGTIEPAKTRKSGLEIFSRLRSLEVALVRRPAGAFIVKDGLPPWGGRSGAPGTQELVFSRIVILGSHMIIVMGLCLLERPQVLTLQVSK